LPKRSELPLEERQYGHYYLILAGLLALTTFWAIWDMIRERAPWQRYQMSLNAAEVGLIQDEIDLAEEEFAVDYGEEYSEVEAELAQARANLTGEEFQSVQAELAQADEKIQDVMQRYRFAKSEYDAIWYEYKHAQHEGHDEQAQQIRVKVDELDAEVKKLKQGWDDAEAAKEEIEKKAAGYRETVEQLEAKLAELREPVTQLSDRLERVQDRKIAIEQFVLADFVKGNFESYLDQVDRCTSCHVNTDKGGYNDFEVPFQTHSKRDELLKTHPVSEFGCTPCHDGQGEALRLPYAHGFVKHWQYPMLDLEMVEAGCNKCHKAEMKIDHAPRLTKAKRMVFDLGCYGCHDIAGYENLRKIGPPLNAITKKTSTEFIYR